MKKFKNISGSSGIWAGQTITNNSYYSIQYSELYRWQSDSEVLESIASGSCQMSDGVSDISDPGSGLRFLLDSQPIDENTGGLKHSPKYAPDGWTQQMFELEFKTSKLNSIHEKNYLNQDIGWASLKFYKLVSGVETQITGEDLNDTFLPSNCVRTDLLWMPNIDYMIKAGFIAQLEIPTDNIYVWALGADLDEAYGGPQSTFLEGGLNLSFADKNQLLGMNGVSGTLLHYTHPLLGGGAGTNRIRFVVRHPVGTQHRLQAVFEIFRG
jgi:hypothetical protein